MRRARGVAEPWDDILRFSTSSHSVLTDCDAFGTFPPRAFAPLFQALRHPGLVACLAPGLRLEKLRHGPLAYGPLSSGRLDRGLTRDWVQPLASKDIRRDLAKFARGVDPRILLDAASRFSHFTGPVRVLWGEGDPFFRTELGRQLTEAFPRATLTTVPAARTFLPLDHPGEFGDEITAASRDAAPRERYAGPAERAEIGATTEEPLQSGNSPHPSEGRGGV